MIRLDSAPTPPATANKSLKSTVEAEARQAARATMPRVHDVLVRSPRLNEALGDVTRPFIKHYFNAPAAPGADHGPAPLSPATIEQARAVMAANFKPGSGKVLVGIAGGGKETVHSFVVTGVRPDGKVTITQALAQYGDRPETYKGVGGEVSKALDKMLGNKPDRMQGVVEEDWSTYAAQYKRNSIALFEMDADPKKVNEALTKLKGMVGKPYDSTMLASDPATPATEQEMYCTEVSSWFLNQIRPGTIKPSDILGYPIYQVKDHMAATDLHGGPLKVLFNGENRLDIQHEDPVPHQAPAAK